MSALRDFWALARPFWWRRDNYLAWLLLASIIAIGLLLVQLNVWFAHWNKAFYDALGAFNAPLIYPLLGKYCLLVAGAVVMTVYVDWLRKLLILRWRSFMTESLSAEWLEENAFYRLGLRGEPDNPDQRIAEDVDLLVSDSIDLLRSFISAVARIASFSVLLWSLSSDLVVPFADPSLRIPGYLLWFALIYAVCGTYVADRIGHVLQGLNYEQQKREADLRATLLRRRDHAEQIALHGGGGHEQQRIMQRFGAIASNWRALMNRERTLGFFTAGFNRINGLVPIFAALPSFMERKITLGDLMQIETAFGQVASALSWFIRAYGAIAKWRATVLRLTQFRAAIHAARKDARPLLRGDRLAVKDLALSRPDGQTLLAGLSFSVAPGSWVRLNGRSGLGKSTLLRSLAGLWPHHQGQLQLPPGRCLFLPQQPYMATDSLAAVLAYPALELASPDVLRALLVRVGLAHLQPRLGEVAEWSRVLSGGEQQRLAIARAMLQRPDCLLMDEATSQIDDQGALVLLRELRACLPQATLVSITHQGVLADLFDHEIDLQHAADDNMHTQHQTALACVA